MTWAVEIAGTGGAFTPTSSVFESTETYTKLSIITEINPTDLYASADNFFEAVNIFEVNYRSFVSDATKLRVRFQTTAGATYLFIPAGIPTGVFTTLECTAEEVGADVQISIKVGGVEVSSHTQTNATLSHNTRTGTIFNAAASAQFKYLQVYKDDVLTFDWDATASSHATGVPVLTDTVSGNHATANGTVPTDGSAWINLGGAISAAISGTVTPTSTEVDIVNGGKTIIITLTGDTWQPSGVDFDNQRQSIINGLVSAQSELLGWNNEVRDNELVTSVVRTSDTVVTITLSAAINYDITSDEIITATVPSSALVTSTSDIVGDVTFTITPTALGFNIAWAMDSNELIY